MKNGIVTALIALVFGFAGAALWSVSGLGDARMGQYMLANPELLPKMADAYQRQEANRKLASVADEVAAPFPGAVLGNPNGTRTLVKFTDYGCSYCRASIADIDRLVAQDKNLKVIVREWPIFPGSEKAARMALAAARQGKFAAYYHAVFALGPPSDASVTRAAREAGLDMEAAEAFAASDAASAELAKNMALAQTLGFSGTPSWVAGGQILEGYVGHDRLAEALKAADEAG